jgi:hypothetical protein
MVTIYEELSQIKKSLLEGLITEEEASTLKARVLGGPPTTQDASKDALAEHFKEAEMRNLQPWRRDLQRFKNVEEEWSKMSLEEKQKIFWQKTKTGRISSTEAMLSIYVLYGSEKDLHFLRSLLVSSSGANRMFMHNFYVAQSRESSFLQMYGDRVVNLTSPLFPPLEQYNVYNDMLLNEEVEGGGPDRRPLFKEAEDGDPMGGAVSFPVLSGQDGSQYVDMTAVDNAVYALQKQQTAINTTIQSLQQQQTAARNSKIPWWKKKQGYYQQGNQQQFTNAQPQHQHNNNNHNNNSQNYPAPPYNAQGYPNRGNPGGGEAPGTPATTTKKL